MAKILAASLLVALQLLPGATGQTFQQVASFGTGLHGFSSGAVVPIPSMNAFVIATTSTDSAVVVVNASTGQTVALQAIGALGKGAIVGWTAVEAGQYFPIPCVYVVAAAGGNGATMYQLSLPALTILQSTTITPAFYSTSSVTLFASPNIPGLYAVWPSVADNGANTYEDVIAYDPTTLHQAASTAIGVPVGSYANSMGIACSSGNNIYVPRSDLQPLVFPNNYPCLETYLNVFQGISVTWVGNTNYEENCNGGEGYVSIACAVPSGPNPLQSYSMTNVWTIIVEDSSSNTVFLYQPPQFATSGPIDIVTDATGDYLAIQYSSTANPGVQPLVIVGLPLSASSASGEVITETSLLTPFRSKTGNYVVNFPGTPFPAFFTRQGAIAVVVAVNDVYGSVYIWSFSSNTSTPVLLTQLDPLGIPSIAAVVFKTGAAPSASPSPPVSAARLGQGRGSDAQVSTVVSSGSGGVASGAQAGMTQTGGQGSRWNTLPSYNIIYAVSSTQPVEACSLIQYPSNNLIACAKSNVYANALGIYPDQVRGVATSVMQTLSGPNVAVFAIGPQGQLVAQVASTTLFDMATNNQWIQWAAQDAAVGRVVVGISDRQRDTATAMVEYNASSNTFLAINMQVIATAAIGVVWNHGPTNGTDTFVVIGGNIYSEPYVALFTSVPGQPLGSPTSSFALSSIASLGTPIAAAMDGVRGYLYLQFWDGTSVNTVSRVDVQAGTVVDSVSFTDATVVPCGMVLDSIIGSIILPMCTPAVFLQTPQLGAYIRYIDVPPQATTMSMSWYVTFDQLNNYQPVNFALSSGSIDPNSHLAVFGTLTQWSTGQPGQVYTMPIYIPPYPSPTYGPPSNPPGGIPIAIVGGAGGGAALLLLAVAVGCCCCRRTTKKEELVTGKQEGRQFSTQEGYQTLQ
jgi:hypothetical protein